MIGFQKKVLSFGCLVLLGLTAYPAFSAGPGITLTLDGKPVTSVPVDQLGKIQIKVSTGGPSFKSVFSGQWSGIDQTLSLAGQIYHQGNPEPDIKSAHGWSGYGMERTGYDANWAGKNTSTASMADAAKVDGLSLFKATDSDNVAFTFRFRRKVYTGKQIWENGGWVKETRWEAAGPTMGKASLKLQPPTFASSLDPNQLFAPALEKFNAPAKSEYDDNRAELISRTLLYPQSYGGRKVDFKGTKITGFEVVPGKKPAFNWNYLDKGGELVHAEMTVNMKIHAVMHTQFESLPVPMNTEADFDCPIAISADRMLNSGNWVTSDLEFNDEIRKVCKTPDGKTPDDIVKTVNPMGGAKSPQDILKGFGF
ncbi:hypothetical protein COW36_09505 [bacterium (Candidatus Blackallbacteria) CG17_big_fil_post_rev_8_21_14_2_50_48_46]|uniref:Uncharacterized protein n=1 Tax=bacterium (Candidatus Blackallbacteria) CG17_big_fil_post_rev_8_21_14_2_50_48_46 TaxID=2014261 RepID=A0A2M7G5E7_9BACT|nr:MAG: hypothetical protein COW64_01905 [bacterium (Candidatus Blackallbacteria) CG18_big_fil_WC_8_21_14_2_50_49_26]PIW17198.1 MAG: hypothetical protein COW36_09505 [bacterium (Candidatus Blackallbacteria) CG17_big_fil_post_rev_8_21_14_2_50_48_46]PIW50989.1 MAG: hypothetical protein COW20_00515 [bacterium (Candidatus Blackallbacteria) CG13_big_fil_rev_8_21_14_2_50_49_14]